ncbi:MAG: hypothetical protein ACLPWS_07525 [Rhodomicrobium sp.]
MTPEFAANSRFFHTLEGGNPFLLLEQELVWVPAFAGTTLRRKIHGSGNIGVIKPRYEVKPRRGSDFAKVQNQEHDPLTP